MPDTRRCNGKSCNDEIRFVTIEMYTKGANPEKKPHPIDIVPNAEKGNIVVLGDTGVRVGKKRKAELMEKDPTIKFYTSHFETCSDAAAFRALKGKR